MKILLIAPPWLEIYGDYKAAAKVGLVTPPLGLAYLGGGILATGSECEVLDMEAEQLTTEGLIAHIKENKPDLIGLTATTPIFHNATVLAEQIKKEFPIIPLALGGVHSTIVGKKALEECPYFDFQVQGEAEITIQEIIFALENGKSLEGITGVNFRQGDTIVENPKRISIDNIDQIPIAARHLLGNNNYKSYLPNSGSTSYTGIFTSRGCPYECTFCSQHTMYGRKVRNHTIERVIEEIRVIVEENGIQHLIIMDDTLTVNKKRMMKLCEAIKKSGLKFTWEGWTHAATVDEEVLQTMKEAGLIRLSFGIESGDPEILKSIKKGATLNHIKNAYRIARKVGLETRGSAIIGHPNETKASAWRTLKFIRSLKDCQQMFLNVATPYPGTELYDAAVNGTGGMRLLKTDYSEYKRYGDPVISVNDLSPRDLKKLQMIGLIMFYMTPYRFWYNIFRRSTLKAGVVNVYAFGISILRTFFHFEKGDRSRDNVPHFSGGTF